MAVKDFTGEGKGVGLSAEDIYGSLHFYKIQEDVQREYHQRFEPTRFLRARERHFSPTDTITLRGKHRFSEFISATASSQVESTFENMVEKWRKDTMFVSSSTKIVAHPAYLRIIGLGPDVIPLILHSMRERPEHWFVALEALSGENPVSEDIAGNMAAMTQAWLDWGLENGYADDDELISL